MRHLLLMVVMIIVAFTIWGALIWLFTAHR